MLIMLFLMRNFTVLSHTIGVVAETETAHSKTSTINRFESNDDCFRLHYFLILIVDA